MGYIDTHCHIHEDGYEGADEAYVRARDAGVEAMIVVGTNVVSSEQALRFANTHDDVYASVGIHPHDVNQNEVSAIQTLIKHEQSRVDATPLVAVGEIGLDYFYTHSPREQQIAAFEAQLQYVHDAALPVIFHVRDAFEDFWPIFRNFSGLRGVLHSFTDTRATLETALSEGLYIGVNGISTFARDKADMYAAIPLERMVLETDAPFLTPVPYRGKINEPAYVRFVAEHQADIRKLLVADVTRATTVNSRKLFTLMHA